MKKTLKKLAAGLLTFSLVPSMVTIPAFATENANAPQITINLTPGAETSVSTVEETEQGTYSREVTATTSTIEIKKEQTTGEWKAPQSALKFDRNSTTDQTAQRKVRDLYTDNGHFTDPASVAVTDAPEGYPMKYIGSGDYSGHYVSHIRVVYERDEDGNALTDADGNYVIKQLEHSNGTVLTTNLEPTLSFDGPYDQTTGTRPLQFLLKDEAGNTAYAYCIDLATGAEANYWYAIANLEDNNYYASKEAEDHVRGIVFNGYWGTADGETGSLSSLKSALKEALKDGKIEAVYDVHFRNRDANKGQALAEGQYASNSYVYTPLYQQITLTDEIIDGLTEGEALDAMQSAIWSYANGSLANLDGTDRMVVGDLYYASSKMGDSRNGVNDFEGAARTKALYTWLMKQKASAESVVINDKTFAKDMSLTIGNEIEEGIYDVSLKFSMESEVDDSKDDLDVVLTYVDAYGTTQTIEEALTGEGALTADADGYYTFEGLQLKEGEAFEYTLNINGEQYLEKNAYVYTAQGGTDKSQTMVGMAEGTIQVDVSKSVDVMFEVDDTFEEPPTPPAPPTISFKSGQASNISFMLIDEDGNVEFLYKVDIDDETSFEIPTEEGKISAVFVKQSTSGMFWTYEQVSDEVMDDVIDCLKAHNPSYKGYNAIAYGAGSHELEFKSGKYATYVFDGMNNGSIVVEEEEVVEEPETEAVVEPETEPETEAVVEPETEPETEAVVEPETEPETEAVVEPETEPETEAVVEPETEPETEAVVEPETEPETEAVVEPETEPETEVEAEPETDPEPILMYDVDGAKIADWMIEDGVTAIYIKASGKIPAIIWTSEEVDADDFIEAFGVDDEAIIISGLGKKKIEYQHNKNKTKTVTYTFTEVE